MSDDRGRKGGDREKPAEAPAPGAAEPQGDSLEDASDEMVRFIKQGDEPGHAGRGDAG